MKKTKKIKPGDLVEYFSINKKRRAQVLSIKENGNLILDTRRQGLMKNVCVMPHRVKLV